MDTIFKTFFKLGNLFKILLAYVFFMIFVFGNNVGNKLVLASKVISTQNQTKNVIPIAMATDDNYVYPTLVSMTSMLENKNEDTKLEFHIMLSGKVTGENKENFRKLIKHYPDCSVNLIDMKDRFSRVQVGGHITTPTYYRLNLPSLLSKHDKVLYIDGDTVVNKDLWELFNTNINEYYIAGVIGLGMCAMQTQEFKEDYVKKLGIANMEQYVNAGVLLINSEKMRKDKIEKKFSDYISGVDKKNVYLFDQDVINAVCYGKIKLLSPIYNMTVNTFSVYEKAKPDFLQNCCSDEDWKRVRTDPVIIYWASSNKPWKNQNIKFYSLWDKYRKVTEKIVYGNPVLKDGLYSIVSALSDQRVLDITYSSKENGGNLQLWEDNGTCAQTFRVKYVGEGYYEIESLCSGKVLDVEYSGKKTGTNVWQYERNGTDAQKWLIKKADDDNSGYYYIISKCNGLCLDVRYSETKPGTNIHVWERNGTNAQKFKFVA